MRRPECARQTKNTLFKPKTPTTEHNRGLAVRVTARGSHPAIHMQPSCVAPAHCRHRPLGSTNGNAAPQELMLQVQSMHHHRCPLASPLTLLHHTMHHAEVGERKASVSCRSPACPLLPTLRAMRHRARASGSRSARGLLPPLHPPFLAGLMRRERGVHERRRAARSPSEQATRRAAPETLPNPA